MNFQLFLIQDYLCVIKPFVNMCGCKANNGKRFVSKRQPKKTVKKQEKVIYATTTKINNNTKYNYGM